MTPTFSGEVQLAGWTDSHNGGAKVTFWLPERSQLDVFAGLTARKGNTAGHRFAMVLVEIGDDEQPVVQETPRPDETTMPPPGGPLSRLAGLWCQDPAFQAWVATQEGFGAVIRTAPPGMQPDDMAKLVVRAVCNVQSRAEIDHSPEAAALFHNQIRLPYSAYLRDLGSAS